jgi:hypothetical protein
MTRDAVMALIVAARDERVAVRRASLQGLGHFPAFWEESYGVVLNAIGNPDGNAFIAQDSLRLLATRAIPELFKRLAEKPLDEDTLGRIYTFHGRSTQGDVIQRLIQEHQSQLIPILENTGRSDLLNIASLLLYAIDTPEAKAATAASAARRNAAKAKAAAERTLRETTPQTMGQIRATLALSTDPREDLQLDSVTNVLEDDALLYSKHRSESQEELLELWQKRGNGYVQLRKIFLEDGAAEFEKQGAFEFDGNTFFHVQVHYPGTGGFRDHYIYRLDRQTNAVEDVKIVPGEFKLEKGEVVQRGDQIQINDNSITLWFGIWKENAPGCCPFDQVRGTYTIKRDPQGVWTMSPENMRRSPID